MSGWMVWGAMSIAGVAATAFVVSRPDSRTFPYPISTVRERLASAPLPAEILLGAANNAKMERLDDGIGWSLGEGAGAGYAKVRLSAEGASTFVSWSVRLPDDVFGDSRIGRAELTATMAESLFAEHIASVVAGRAFDQKQAAFRVAQELEVNPEMLAEFGDAVRDEMIATSEHLEQSMNLENRPTRTVSPTHVNDNSFAPMTRLDR